MAKREWVGEYTLHYSVFYSYKNEWVDRVTSLGKCLGNEEAIQRAVMFLAHTDDVVKPRYIADGWGNHFTA